MTTDDETPPEASRSALSVELDRRKAHLDALPGTRFKEDLEALNRASYVLGTNGQELRNHIVSFIESSQQARNLGENYSNELVRLLHNYLTAVSSLIDAQRVVIRHCWPQEDDQRRLPFQGTFDQRRTEAFETDEAAFITKLRNYCTHYTIPVPGPGTSLSWTNGGPVIHLNTLQLDRDKLLPWKGWGGPAKRYLIAQPERFDLAPIIERYMTSASSLFGWFWEAINESNREIRDETLRKGQELLLWHEEVAFTPKWIQDGLNSPPPEWRAKRDRAERRNKRFTHGTRGYVAHSVDTEGMIEFTDDPWWPFPNRM